MVHGNSAARLARVAWQVGPGGLRCACCAPAPGAPRRAERRAAKRRDKRRARKAVRAEVEAYLDDSALARL